ncbi:transcription initiation factor TFIID subunit 4b-like isoform X2 [Canna indica]|uniref:Transcription initiation factor TFIID subunit 4b-like isoform X2 n=1 Tax=Canna indica TaxID=4628 RepID=A0AAQ3KZR4_9LILI|nr:transcription initiation factor TFIID subunit 4b-like isoform X2 [Canna indica]
MDPSIMKLLEEDEDESMHSGADVEALSAALNRDIGGDPAAISHPSVPKTGLSMQGSSSASEQVLGQWKTSSNVENDQQIQQIEQKQPFQSSEQLSSGGELIQPGSVAQPQGKQFNTQSEQEQLAFQQDSNNPQQLSETNSLQFVEKEQIKKSEESTILALGTDTTEGSKQEMAQHSDNQQHHNVKQSNSQQISSANLANMATQHSESHQKHTVDQSNSQQTSTPDQSNMATRRTKSASSIPFHMLIPILRPHLDKDRSMQLQAIFTKLRNNEVSKEDFLRVIRNIVGDQMLRQAAQKVQMQQLQSQAARNVQPNANPFSSQLQTSSPQLSSSGIQQVTRPQTFPAHHSVQSAQNPKVIGSSSGQPYVPSSTFQLRPNAGLTVPENSTLKSREVETRSDVKGSHSVQNYAISMNKSNPERDGPMVSLQTVNKQQHHTQLPQSSFSMSGNSSSYNTHAFPRPSMSSSSSLRPPSLDTHTRQVSHAQGLGSTQVRPNQSTNIMNMPTFEQNSANETKRQQISSLTSHSSSQQNAVPWQLSTNKEKKSSGLQSTSYVKQEVVDQPSEPPNKSHFASSQNTSFVSAHYNQGNSVLGSSSMIGTSQVSGPISSQADQSGQVSSATPSLTGATTKTPSKKPTAGQKKPIEAIGSSPPMSSKKQKTSGNFLEQSIEQLNDVTAVSGVNLREEEEQLLSGMKEESRASEATRRVVQEEEERLILQKATLQKKLSDIMSKCGLKNIGGDVERCLSMCVEERLKGLISYLIRLSKQRVDTEKSRHRFVITSDVRRQILSMNQKAKEDWDKKQTEESEKHRKVNEADGNTGVDTEKDKEEGRSKTVKVNKEEDDKLRTTAANVAARAAVGGDDMLSKWQLMAEQARQKREGHDGPSSSQLGKTASSKSSLGRASKEKQESEKKGSAMSASGGARRFGRNNAQLHPKVARNISLKDVIAALSREPQMSKSPLIYRLYERLPGDSSV